MPLDNFGYFNNHYTDFSITDPSSFAIEMTSKYLREKHTVIELGCGNGRDGIQIVKSNCNYIGFDINARAIEAAQLTFQKSNIPENLYKLEVSSVVDFPFENYMKNDLIIYSRFFLHSISEEEENLLLNKFENNLKKGTIFMLETRTIFDELFGVGEFQNLNTYKSDHLRRFIDPISFYKKIEKQFKILEYGVSKNWAKFEDANPFVLRAVFIN